MKKLFVCLLGLLMFASLCTAQEIKVLDITELTTDLQARTSPRRDMNGELCALVKIALPTIDDIEFGGNVVGTVVYRNGVYNVYVPAGTKRISFSHNDYYPGTIDFEAFNVVISSSTTYSVRLDPGVRAAAQENVQTPVQEAIAQKTENVEAPVTAPVAQPVAPAPKEKTPKEKPEKAPKVKVEKVRPAPEPFAFGSAVVGIAPGSGELSYGAMGGWVNKFGGYAKFRSSFSAVATDGEYTVSQLQTGWTEGAEQKGRMTFTAGAIAHVTNAIYPFVGAGYGKRSSAVKLWDEGSSEERWVGITDRTYSGAAVEAGVLFKLGPAVLSLSANCTAFKYTDFEIGVGLSF